MTLQSTHSASSLVRARRWHQRLCSLREKNVKRGTWNVRASCSSGAIHWLANTNPTRTLSRNLPGSTHRPDGEVQLQPAPAPAAAAIVAVQCIPRLLLVWGNLGINATLCCSPGSPRTLESHRRRRAWGGHADLALPHRHQLPPGTALLFHSRPEPCGICI